MLFAAHNVYHGYLTTLSRKYSTAGALLWIDKLVDGYADETPLHAVGCVDKCAYSTAHEGHYVYQRAWWAQLSRQRWCTAPAYQRGKETSPRVFSGNPFR